MSAKKTSHFNLQTNFPKGSENRYPLGRFPFKVDISFGGVSRRREAMQINDRVPVNNSADKTRTRKIWKDNGISDVKFAPLMKYITNSVFNMDAFEEEFNYPVVLKLKLGERSKGFKYINNADDFTTFLSNPSEHKKSEYFIEERITFDKEYRIHVAPILEGVSVGYTFTSLEREHIRVRNNGVIAVHQKMITQEAYDRGIRHANRGGDYASIKIRHAIDESVIASAIPTVVNSIRVLGLDFGFVDMGVDSASGQFFLFESGANPELAGPEIQQYITALKNIILLKGKKENRFPQGYLNQVVSVANSATTAYAANRRHPQVIDSSRRVPVK